MKHPPRKRAKQPPAKPIKRRKRVDRPPRKAAAPPASPPAAANYHALPKLLWVRWSGRQHKVLNDQARLYGLPVGGPTIDLAEVARWLHNLLAEHGRKILAGDAADDVETGETGSPALERKREVEYQLRLRDLAERDGTLADTGKLRQGLAAIAGVIRQCGDTLQRQHGADALDVLNDSLADCERAIDALFGEDQ